ncbi:MAG: flagellar motor switch protein FliG [Cyanobacteria bacterium RYN_339]|nr:flagellar motor switch protein FliG [Cyanobacteria bacterium RYN_339]
MSEFDVELGGDRAGVAPVVPLPQGLTLPDDHPLAAIGQLLAAPELYAGIDPDELPFPAHVLVRAMVLHVLYALGDDQLAVEHLTHNELFRCFIGDGWRPGAYTASRERMIALDPNPFALAAEALQAAGWWDRLPYEPDRLRLGDWGNLLQVDFYNLDRLDNRSIQRLLRDVDTRELALALKGAPDPILDRVLSNVSTRMRTIITDEIGFMGPVRERDIEQVRIHITRHLRRLIAQDEILPPSQ